MMNSTRTLVKVAAQIFQLMNSFEFHIIQDSNWQLEIWLSCHIGTAKLDTHLPTSHFSRTHEEKYFYSKLKNENTEQTR